MALSRRFVQEGPGWRQLMNAPRGRHCHQDCPWLARGAILHIKAQVDGAGVCIADVHGYQPAGELAFAGIEVAANVQLRVERSRGWLVDWPLIETADEIMVFASYAAVQGEPHTTYDQVVRQAYRAMREVVKARVGCTDKEANDIAAAAVDIRNCAIYGPAQGYDPGVDGDHPGAIAAVAAVAKDIFRGR